MMTVSAIGLILLWGIPAMLRTWRMGRFYQIEEYMSGRFIRWLGAKRERWFPRRPAIAMLLGVIGSFILQLMNAERTLVHLALWVAVCGVVAWPPPVKETKKDFVRTPRAMRLMVTTLVLNVVLVVLLSFFSSQATSSQWFSGIAIAGFVVFLLSPLLLPIGRLIVEPYEAHQREGFRKQARARLAAAKVVTIGITGSYGKTSTKTYLAHILGATYKVFPTPKSYNTEMGVCRAINEGLDPSDGYQYFIAEMGAYVPGEIERICKLTEPQISVVTAVGPMHLERFGTLQNIVKAKYEIVEGVPPDGATFFNADNPHVYEMTTRNYPTTRILVSQKGLAEAHLRAENVQETIEGLRFDLHDSGTGQVIPVQTDLIGRHNVTNILLAAAVAQHLGLDLATIAQQIRTLESAEHRLRVNRLPNNILIIDDAYSANPVGAANALAVLNLHQVGRRILITPGMVELGPLQDEENYKLGQQATEVASIIVLVGIEQTKPLQDGIASTAFDPANVLVFDTFQEAQAWFQASVRAGDAVLFLNDLPDTYL